jgi:catechol 2,3-dioxygenase-like lactoylglutathione lyase family enzyme
LPSGAGGSTIAGDTQHLFPLRVDPDEEMAMKVTSPQADTAAASVLASTQVTCMLPVKDMARARHYYEDALGLVPLGAKPDGKFVYRCGGTELALFPKPEGTKAEHTAISFKVADIAATIAALKSRGVVFDDYDLPGFKTVEHVCVLGSERAAWFRDPEGNILCLHEDLG